MFKPSVDQWPVRLDSSGNPLKYGRLRYTQIGTVSVPKAVYFESARITPVLETVYCNGAGRTTSQVFLGYGEYTVISERFVGDPLAPTEQDYVADGQWSEFGGLSPTTLGEGPTYVGTIAELRLVDPDVYTHVIVEGYWEVGDMSPRAYKWGAYGPDDGGQVIASIGEDEYQGAWHTVVEGDMVDCRLYGIMGGSDWHQSAQILAAVAALKIQACPATLYFPPGNYYLASSMDLGIAYLDTGCYFRTIGSIEDDVVVTLHTGSTVAHEHTFTGAGSDAKVYPSFVGWSGPLTVNPRWWSAPYEALALAWARMLPFITPASTIYVEGIHSIGDPGADVSIDWPLLFDAGAALDFSSDPHSFFLRGHSSVSPAARACFRGTLSRLHFKDYKEIRASWYEDPSLPGTSLDLGAILTHLGTSGIGITRFIFDLPVCLFSTGLSGMASNPFVYSGTGLITSPTSEEIRLLRCHFGRARVFGSQGIIVGGAVSLPNWPAGPTGYTYALHSATNGSGELDLCGMTVSLTGSISPTVGAQKGLWIHGGTLNVPASTTSFAPVGAWGRIILSDLTVVLTGMSSFVQAGQATGSLYLDRVKVSGGSTSQLISGSGFSALARLSLSRSNVSVATLIHPAVVVTQVTLYDNDSLTGDLTLTRATLMSTGNRVTGSSATLAQGWRFVQPGGITIASNRFYRTVITVEQDLLLKIHALLHGNQFESTDAVRCQVKYLASAAHVLFAGALAVANSFTGSITTQHVAVVHDVSGTGSFADYLTIGNGRHRLCLTTNAGASSFQVVPVTRGFVPLARANTPLKPGSTWELDLTRRVVDLDQVGIFYLAYPPGGSVVSYAHGSMYNAVSGLLPQNLRLPCWDYRSSGDTVEVAWGEGGLSDNSNLFLPQPIQFRVSIFQ